MAKKVVARKPARKKAGSRAAASSTGATKARAVGKKSQGKKAPVKKRPAKKSVSKKQPDGLPPQLNGWITHTEFASADPNGMKAWLTDVLGWKFRQSMPMPHGGEYLLYMYSEMGGGGIRPTERGEEPSTVPYVQVASVQRTFDKAIREGAQEMIAPNMIVEDLWIACVRAPGGVAIGFAGPK